MNALPGTAIDTSTGTATGASTGTPMGALTGTVSHTSHATPANTINQAGILAISTRLQRLSDQLRKDGLLIYKANGIDFEPKWFPVVYSLYIKPVWGVVELATEIGYSHPSTISLLKELEKQKLIRSSKDKADERRRLIRLTDKGKALVEQMQPVWRLMTAAVTELTNTTNNLMKAIDEVEAQMKQKSFYERALFLQNEKSDKA